MNTTLLFNDGWEFAKSGLETVDCGDLSFALIHLTLADLWTLSTCMKTASGGTAGSTSIQGRIEYSLILMESIWTLPCM